MAERKEDLRVTKTRAALSSTFFKMLADMELNDITVNKLCEMSGVRRATFYKHFRDKDDFIIFVIKDVRARFDREIWQKEEGEIVTRDYHHKYAAALLAFLLKHETAMKRVASSEMRSAFIDVFLRQNYADTKRLLEAGEAAGEHLFASSATVASILIGGIAQCIIRWFDSDENRCPPEALLKDISTFIDRILA